MNAPRLSAVGFALLTLTAVAAAGPVEFGFSTGNIVVSGADKPGLNLILQPFQPPGPVNTYTPGSNTPLRLPAVQYDPHALPAPAGVDLHWSGQEGYTHLNIDGQLAVDVHLWDMASDQEGVVHLTGRAHTYNSYTTTGGWVPTSPNGTAIDTWFWFAGEGQVKLGENTYTVRAVNDMTGTASVDVWVNDVPPAQTPEPATMLLAGIGLAGVTGAGWLRRRASGRHRGESAPQT